MLGNPSLTWKLRQIQLLLSTAMLMRYHLLIFSTLTLTLRKLILIGLLISLRKYRNFRQDCLKRQLKIQIKILHLWEFAKLQILLRLEILLLFHHNKHQPTSFIKLFCRSDNIWHTSRVYCLDPNHRIYECPEFHRLNPWNCILAAVRADLCMMFLAERHLTLNCRSETSCHFSQYYQRHHTLLHYFFTLETSERSIPYYRK